MKNISPEICRRFGLARKERGIKQSALALELNCKQPALSMFEAGDSTKLSEEVVKKLSEKFNIPLIETKEPALEELKDDQAVLSEGLLHGFCPSCQCLSNVPYTIEGRLYFRPVFSRAAPVIGAKRCAVCGEVLEKRCPTCGAPLNEGACCAVCGLPYVTVTLPGSVDTAAWARIRREEITAVFNFA